MKYYYLIFVYLLLIILAAPEAAAQCSCFGASIGGLTPVGGTTNIGVIKEKNLRANLFYKYSFGDTYYKGDTKLTDGDIKNYFSHYMSLNAGYGVTNDFTLEGEFGYFAQKKQDFNYWKESASGPSHLMLSGKYNVFNSLKSEFEFTAGLSIRMPFPTGTDTAFKFVRPSNGAWNFGLNLFAYKGYHKAGLHFFLLNRTEFNTENKYGYTFGTANFTSFYTAYQPLQLITAIMEIRNEFRLRDYFNDKYAGDSGGDALLLVPQVNLDFSPVNLSLFCEIPLYATYNGTQLAHGYSAGLNIAWNYNFNASNP